ncbi:hypothetical protein IV203_001336 [Nitzschia inconspicua]|uniref:Uncharacterized protein n=1 Tax=Nitzschia inconspicua TaxID=303405 RepID=A0A9K3PQV9_9STRA|nr:hypothetical protein IV203_001336 [Nitzschia inconspicua]
MKVFLNTTILAAVLVMALASPVSAEKERIGPQVGGSQHGEDEPLDSRNGGATDTRDALIIPTGRQEPDPWCGGDSIHHQNPCRIDVQSPEMVPPTDPPVSSLDTSSPTEAPTQDEETVTSMPTVPTIGEPSASPTGVPQVPCISTDGTFGVVSGTPDTDVMVSYMYEMETAAGVSKETIDSVILPQLEKSIVDSVLAEVFPGGCIGTEVGKRYLRLQRRLVVTGITMNPSDLINEEFVCDSTAVTDQNNGCNIIDGQLTLYTTDGEATEASQEIKRIIRKNMDNGVYASSNSDIVRLSYLDVAPSPPESGLDGNTGGENNEGTTGGGTSNELRVGLFVGLIGGAIIIAGVLYRKVRTRHTDDETDLQTTNAGSAMQPQEPLNDAGVISYEESVASYDETGMVMADTGMDSVSSDGLGIAT